jgi:Icc protein
MDAMTQQAQTIIQISDTHLMEHADATFVEMCPEHSFHDIMQHIVAQHPDAQVIIHTGDVAHDATPVTYARYLQYMQRLGIPFYQTPGNHDDLEIFPYSQSSPITVIDLKPWTIILLTSAVTGKIDGHIDQDQLDQLDQLLQQINDGFVLIGCHHHPLHMQSDWKDQHCFSDDDDQSRLIAYAVDDDGSRSAQNHHLFVVAIALIDLIDLDQYVHQFFP